MITDNIRRDIDDLGRFAGRYGDSEHDAEWRRVNAWLAAKPAAEWQPVEDLLERFGSTDYPLTLIVDDSALELADRDGGIRIVLPPDLRLCRLS